MTEYTFKVRLDGITELECFKDATKDEMKILVALASKEGMRVSLESLADSLEVSVARVKSAIALFEESGVLAKCDDLLAEIEYEFDLKEKNEDSSKRSAKSIRDNNLYEMYSEIEIIFEKTLEPREIERVESLYTKCGLSVEFILTLAAYLKDKRQLLTIEGLVREATKLLNKSIDNLEALEIYIKEKNEEIAGEMEMRRLFGIQNRALVPSERKYFKKWLHDYCYSAVIIGEAYDISVTATGKLSLGYIDSILTEWHDTGCKTLEECRARVDIRKQERAKKANNNSQKRKKAVEAETPKYADFNSEDALLRALERSYGDEKKGG